MPIMSCVENAVAEIEKKYQQKYGFAVFDLKFRETRDKIILEGEVLTGKQREEVAAAVAVLCRKKVKNKIKVLSDAGGNEIGWAVVKNNIIDLRSRLISDAVINEKIMNRVRATQAKKGDILRILLSKDGQLLAQSGDLTLGWVNRGGVTLKKTSLRKEWSKGIFARPDKLIVVRGGGEKIAEEVEKFLGVQYVLGGKSVFGIDCSGLTQCAYKNAFGIILPKYSWDQKKMGRQVSLEKAETGDLVFMENKKKGTRHVGIWKKYDGRPCIVHASFAKGKVVCQDAGEVLLKYNLVEIKRIIKK